MLKVADTLAQQKYQVQVVSAKFIHWAFDVDQDIIENRKNLWNWTPIIYCKKKRPFFYYYTGIRFKLFHILAKLFFKINYLPNWLCKRILCRIYPELLRMIKNSNADFYYGGTTGALAVIAAAAREKRIKFALDLEDFHSAEQDNNPLMHMAVNVIEHHILKNASFLTAGSQAIANEYHLQYHIKPLTLNNTFSLPQIKPDFTINESAPIKLYWFSQTIGENRGIEDVIHAIGLSNIAAELHLRGECSPAFKEYLLHLCKTKTTRLTLSIHPPASADQMISLCHEYDVGLALEQGHILNRSICLTNKAFTYMLGGLAIVLTKTTGQQPVINDLENVCIAYEPGDIETLASGLQYWSDNRDRLLAAKQMTWYAACQRWHWSHPEESGKLLSAINKVLP